MESILLEMKETVVKVSGYSNDVFYDNSNLFLALLVRSQFKRPFLERMLQSNQRL